MNNYLDFETGTVNWQDPCYTIFKLVNKLPNVQVATRNHVYVTPDNKMWALNTEGDGYVDLTEKSAIVIDSPKNTIAVAKEDNGKEVIYHLDVSDVITNQIERNTEAIKTKQEQIQLGNNQALVGTEIGNVNRNQVLRDDILRGVDTDASIVSPKALLDAMVANFNNLIQPIKDELVGMINALDPDRIPDLNGFAKAGSRQDPSQVLDTGIYSAGSPGWKDKAPSQWGTLIVENAGSKIHQTFKDTNGKEWRRIGTKGLNDTFTWSKWEEPFQVVVEATKKYGRFIAMPYCTEQSQRSYINRIGDLVVLSLYGSGELGSANIRNISQERIPEGYRPRFTQALTCQKTTNGIFWNGNCYITFAPSGEITFADNGTRGRVEWYGTITWVTDDRKPSEGEVIL